MGKKAYTGTAGLHRASPKMGKQVYTKPPPNPGQISTKPRPIPSKKLKKSIEKLRQQARDLTPKIDSQDMILATQPQVNTPAEEKNIMSQEIILKTWNLIAEEKKALNLRIALGENRENDNQGKCAHCYQIGTNLPVCSRCKMAEYCNPECQQNNWAYHKRICRHLEVLWWGNRRFVD